MLVSAPPVGLTGQAFDTVVLLLSGLSGPFCLLLIPVALLQVLEDRRRTNIWRAGLLCALALVQIHFLLGMPHGGRSTAPLGAGPRMLARIISLEIILGVELGFYTISHIYSLPAWQHNALPLAVTVVGAILACLALLRGSLLLCKFAVFAGLLFASALVSPQVSISDQQWPLMAHPPLGNRYYTIPMLAWVAVLFTLAADRHRILRCIGVALLLVMLVWGIPHDWRELPMPRTDFIARANAFDAAPPGKRMEFPIHPPGLSPMVLVKRAH